MEIQERLSFLGERLLEKERITRDDLQKAESLQKRIGGQTAAILTRIGAVSEDSLLQVLSEITHIPVADARDLPTDPRAFSHAMEQSGIESDWWLDQEALIWEGPDKQICCIARDPLNDSLDEILTRVFPGRNTEFFLTCNYDLDRLLDAAARSKTSPAHGDSDIEQLRQLAEEAPVIAFVNNLLSQAYSQRASDVHIEPGEHILEARFRIDGILYTRFSLPRERFPAISSRIKLISGMDIAERRLPQDGRLSLRLSGDAVDLRVSTVPGVHGESVVLRLLPKESRGFSLETLGLESDTYGLFRQWISEPHGIILVTGPTGSGKSTTLYSALESINDRSKKIITVEDPVEYHLEGITQIQTHSEIGYTFARALRSILRQDPDVILIGEIRDKETAEIAVQASLTGHLVISTLHTNDALSAFTRLIDMGIEPFLVATPIRAVIAQRLVRQLCPECSQPAEPVQAIRESARILIPEEWKQREPNWRDPLGCPVCQGTGYKGRIGIYEALAVTPEMQDMILSRKAAGDMRCLAKTQGARTLREDGLLKAWKGITSLAEVLRVTAEQN